MKDELVVPGMRQNQGVATVTPAWEVLGKGWGRQCAVSSLWSAAP